MAGGRQLFQPFSAQMTLGDYASTLGQLRGHSPDLVCGNESGSFLATYLCHHLMNSGDPMALLARDQFKIKELMRPESGGAKIIFNTASQLSSFFKFLANHVPLYHALIEHGFLSLDATCDDGDTFLNMYFRNVLITVEKIEEAVGLLRVSQSLLAKANKKGEFPLSGFLINLMTDQEVIRKIEKSEAILNRYIALINEFTIAQVVNVASSQLTATFVSFYSLYNESRFMHALINQVLAKAANYGISIHQSLTSLAGKSIVSSILENNLKMKWSPMELREYYLTFNTEFAIRGTLVHYSGFQAQKSAVTIDETDGCMLGVIKAKLQGVVSASDEQPYRLCPDAKPGMLLLDSQAAVKWFPWSCLVDWYGSKRALHGGPTLSHYQHLMRHVDSKEALPSLAGSTSPIPVCNLPNPEASIFKRATHKGAYKYYYIGPAKEGDAVFSAAGVLDHTKKLVVPPMYQYTDHPLAEQYKYVCNFRGKYVAAMQADLKTPEYYHPVSEYYHQVTFNKNANKVSVLSYYLRERGFGHSEDPRYFYNMHRRFVHRATVISQLLAHDSPLQSAFESTEGNSWRYFAENKREMDPENQNIDMAILYHLKKQNCSFAGKEVTDFILSILTEGDFSDPALYRLMMCLRDCGAEFPKNIQLRSFRDHVASQLARTPVEKKYDAIKEHLRVVLDLFQQESPEDVSKVREYVASFGLILPHELTTIQSASAYLLSDEGVRQFNIAMDQSFQEVNCPKQVKYDTRDALAELAVAINERRPYGKLMFDALNLYYRSEDYKQRFKDEQAYYVFFRALMIETCHMASASLQSVKTSSQGGGLFKALNRSRIAGDVINQYIKELSAITEVFAETPEAREAHVKSYFDLIEKAAKDSVDSRKDQNKDQNKDEMSDEVNSINKSVIRSATVRGIVKKFAEGGYLDFEGDAKKHNNDIIALLNPLLPSELKIAVAPLEYEGPKKNQSSQASLSTDTQSISSHDLPPSGVPLEYQPPKSDSLPQTEIPKSGLYPTVEASAPPLDNEEYPGPYKAYQEMIDALYNNDALLTEALEYLNANMSRLPEDDLFAKQIKAMCCPFTGLLAKYACVVNGDSSKYCDLNVALTRKDGQSHIQLRVPSEFQLMSFIVKQAYQVLKPMLIVSDAETTSLYPAVETPKLFG